MRLVIVLSPAEPRMVGADPGHKPGSPTGDDYVIDFPHDDATGEPAHDTIIICKLSMRLDETT